MVKVLWVTPFAPDRFGGGGQIRQAYLLLALAQQATVELVCPASVSDPDVRAAVGRLDEVDPVASDWRGRHPWLRRLADLEASLLLGPPMEVRAFRPVRRALGAALTARLADADADLVLVEFAGLAPLGFLPRRGHGARWVLTLHNLPSRMAAQQAVVMPHRRQRWFLTRDGAAAGAFEQRAAAAFDAVITSTEEDGATLSGSGQVVVIPNGTDVDRFGPSPLPATKRVVFTGALYTTPNIDGARWLCQQVLPLLRRHDPAVEVDLVGARPGAEVRALGRLAGVTVHPDVASVAPFLDAARVAVVPLRVGSGSRLKALEALAAGRPVVGTTIGLEGLGLRDGVNALVADDAVAFAAAVTRLLGDDALATALARAGRAEVEQRFSWPTIGAQFTSAILTLAEGAAPTA